MNPYPSDPQPTNLENTEPSVQKLIAAITALVGLLVLLVLLLVAALSVMAIETWHSPMPPVAPVQQAPPVLSSPLTTQPSAPDNLWQAPADSQLDQLSGPEKELIIYGRDLISHTADYLGPKGSVRPLSNGMNCQNCHLDAGTRPWGNNYFAVESTYPKFRERSGLVESKARRINDCFERSLNGQPLDSNSREMKALLAYMKWLGTGVAPGTTPKGSGIFKLPLLDRAADPQQGKLVYRQKCQSCHQANGAGVASADGKKYAFPPLWGKHSYNTGAGMYRLSNLAGYLRYNMPLGVTYERAQLSDAEAWDVAAFINSMPRPAKDIRNDWPNRAGKPFDHPFGPYDDPFSEKQHKLGPFQPIKDWKERHKKMETSPSPVAVHATQSITR